MTLAIREKYWECSLHFCLFSVFDKQLQQLLTFHGNVTIYHKGKILRSEGLKSTLRNYMSVIDLQYSPKIGKNSAAAHL